MLNRKVIKIEGVPNCVGTLTLPRWIDAATYTRYAERVAKEGDEETADSRYRKQLSIVIENDIVWTDPFDGEEVVMPQLNEYEHPNQLPVELLTFAINSCVRLLNASKDPKDSTARSGTTPSKSGKQKGAKGKK